MSTQYNGNAENTLSNLPASVNIASSTNANPIVITTSAVHGLTTNDFVSVNGHQVNTSANGTWQATVLTTHTYSIPSAGVGVGGATGTSQSLAAGPTYAIPSDGDAITAASVGVALEAIGDRTAFHEAGMSVLKFVGPTGVLLSTDIMSGWDSFTPAALVDGTWNALTGGTVWTIPGNNVQALDYIEISVDLSCNILQTAAKFNQLSLFASVTPPGGADTYIQVPASQRVFQVAQFTNNECFPIRLFGAISAPNSGGLKVTLAGWPVQHSSISVWSFIGAYVVNVNIWRPTGAKS